MSSDDESRRLICLVKGDCHTFTVTVGINKQIYYLKDIIREKGINAAEPLLAKDLKLEKVDIDLTVHNYYSLSQLDINGENLRGWDRISDHWLKQPDNKRLHILVKLPDTGQWRLCSSGGQVVTYNALFLLFMTGFISSNLDQPPLKRPRVNAEWMSPLDVPYSSSTLKDALSRLRPEIEQFIRNHGYMSYWTPPPNVTDQTIHAFFTELKIPVDQEGRPSLLFHGLDGGREDSEIINQIISGDGPSFVCNTSGSGKTRNLLQCLTRHWGFYFVSGKDAHEVGVSDMCTALMSLDSYPGWTSNLQSLPQCERMACETRNKEISSRKLQTVFAARAFVFRLFLGLCKEVNGELTEKDKHLWLKFQLSEAIKPNTIGPVHPFVRVIALLNQVPLDILAGIPGLLVNIQDQYFAGEPIVYVIDEAQVAVRTHPSAFLSSGTQRPRSILREIVRVVSRYPVKLVVSGTGLSLEDFESTLVSGVSKRNVDLVHHLGGFDNWESMEPFIRRYVPSPVLETKEGAMLQYRIRQYLTGRPVWSLFFVGVN
ncbi:hypothetical protein APHAL10511_005201 [Amanita phalloides]|nr:hypothetical protein APHAL10511_005201 [Amanita phalloides]